MRIFWIGVLWMVVAASVVAESYPSAWNYIASDSSAVVGIEWQQLHESFLADAIGVELSGSGRLGFPDLACLRDAREILLAGPDLLGIASGSFPAAQVAAQATALGMRSADYDGVRVWIAPGTRGRSVAQVNNTLLLIGFRDTLEAAIDRSLLTAERQSSPLLARGAHLAATYDLWITATSLPDPLVSVFLPLDLESGDFDAGVSLGLTQGLTLDARYDMATPQDAESSADYFREAVPGFHALLRGMNVIEDGNSVRLKLQVAPQQLAQHLRPPQPEPAKPVMVSPPAPAKPPSVRIVGLDDGPREFPLPEH